jgi:hypothetical protein
MARPRASAGRSLIFAAVSEGIVEGRLRFVMPPDKGKL